MSTRRSKWLVILLLIGIVFYGWIRWSVIPKNEQAEAKYIAEQNSPLTHDLQFILKYQNKYMGNAGNTTQLFHALPLREIPKTFQLFPGELKVQIKYELPVSEVGETLVHQSVLYNSSAAFLLIDNLEIVESVFPDYTYEVDRSIVERWYITPLQFESITKEAWEREVQHPLEHVNEVNERIEMIDVRPTVAED